MPSFSLLFFTNAHSTIPVVYSCRWCDRRCAYLPIRIIFFNLSFFVFGPYLCTFWKFNLYLFWNQTHNALVNVTVFVFSHTRPHILCIYLQSFTPLGICSLSPHFSVSLRLIQFLHHRYGRIGPTMCCSTNMCENELQCWIIKNSCLNRVRIKSTMDIQHLPHRHTPAHLYHQRT